MNTIEKIEYTPLSEVADTLSERRADQELQEKLKSFIGNGTLPKAFMRDNVAVLAEYVARPTGNDLAFLDYTRQADIEPWWVTYESDTFTNANAKKVSMWRPQLALPKGQDVRSWIVAKEDRQEKIGEAPTTFDSTMNVTQYWRGLRRAEFGRVGKERFEENVCDIGDWYRQQAEERNESGSSIAQGYYPAVMGLYAAKAALFCNFDNYPEFYPVALEGYRQASRALGVKPIIVAFDGAKPYESADGRRLLNPAQTDLTWIAPDQTAQLQNKGTI